MGSRHLGVCATIVLVGCSMGGTETPRNAGGLDGGGGLEPAYDAAAPQGLSFAGDLDGGATADAAPSPCAMSIAAPLTRPVDVYVMIDQSGSMGDSVLGGQTKWEAVTGAIGAFAEAPGPGGISLAIQYFGLWPSVPAICGHLHCRSDADCGASVCGPCAPSAGGGLGTCSGYGAFDSCNPQDYRTPEVDFATLPRGAPAILASMAAHGPSTSTPLFPALAGALAHAEDAWQTHRGDVASVVLVTDGAPDECDSLDADLEAIAATALASPAHVLTFVIGVFAENDLASSAPARLNALAAAGGTFGAFVVAADSDVPSALHAALASVQRIALGCTYAVPQPKVGGIDLSSVAVRVTSGAGAVAGWIPRMNAASACPTGSADGFYLAAPTTASLCPSTCTRVASDVTASVEISAECPTELR